LASPIVDLLSEVFPAVAADSVSVPRSCWVARVLRSEGYGLDSLSEAVLVVTRHGQRDLLKKRLAGEHPIGRLRAHHPQYDRAVRDCLSEACAFAWADLRGLGVPSFTFLEKGTPDVRVDAAEQQRTSWIEVKAIHPSDEDNAQTEQMMSTGQSSRGEVPIGPAEGLISKFEYGFQNAKVKFNRSRHATPILFYNLTMVDMSHFLRWKFDRDEILEWVERKRTEDPKVSIVICCKYDWRHPFLDPLEESLK